MIRLAKIATPDDAVAVAVAEPSANVPLSRVSVTVELSPVTTLPYGSSTATVTAGLIATPAGASVGCWTNDTRLAAAGLTVKLALGPPGVSDPSVAVML